MRLPDILIAERLEGGSNEARSIQPSISKPCLINLLSSANFTPRRTLLTKNWSSSGLARALSESLS
jgi:hypothetical protein